MKCEYSDGRICEIRCGVADNPFCRGTEAEMEQCAYVDVNEEDEE